MFDDLDRNIAFVEEAHARGEEALLHLCPHRDEPFMVSGPAESIRVLKEILMDYEWMVDVAKIIFSERFCGPEFAEQVCSHGAENHA